MTKFLKAFLLSSAIAALCMPLLAGEPADPADPPQTPTPAPAPPTPAPQPKPPAAGPVQIKVNDNVNFRFGVLFQPQADFSENQSQQTSENFFIRRTRFIVAGQVAKNAYFFFQTENARLGGAVGGAAKQLGGFQTTDAVAEYRYSKPLNFWAGLIYLPTSREALKSSSSEFMIDTNSYAYTATTALTGTGGRDTGVMARGYFLKDHLEYRVGLFQGLRQTGSRNAFRQIARLQYEFFDTEPYVLPAYPGSYFGTKKIVTVGASYDKQNDYKGPTADLYVDLPTGFGSALGTVTFMHLDGGTFVPTLGKSNIYVADGGVFFKGVKVGPWARYEKRDFADPNSAKDEQRYLVGLNWYPYMNNFNIKAAIGQLRPAVGNKQKQVTLQMQFFYF